MANGGVVAARSQSPEPQGNFGDMVLSFCVIVWVRSQMQKFKVLSLLLLTPSAGMLLYAGVCIYIAAMCSKFPRRPKYR